MHTFFPFSILTLVRLHPLPPTRLLLVMEQSGAAGNWKSILVSNPRNILGLTKKRSWPLFNREEAPSWCKEESSLTSPYLRALIISFLHRAIRFALFRAALNRIPPPIPPLLHAAPSWKSGDREKGNEERGWGTGFGMNFLFLSTSFFPSPGQNRIRFRSRMEIENNKENRCCFLDAFRSIIRYPRFPPGSDNIVRLILRGRFFSWTRGRKFNRATAGKLDPLGVFRFFTTPRSYCTPERNLRRKKLIWISCTDFFKSSPAFMAHYLLAFTSRLPSPLTSADVYLYTFKFSGPRRARTTYFLWFPLRNFHAIL